MNKITKQFIGGMKWTSLSTIIITVVQLLQFALLARILTPEDFGLMGMIMVIIVFSQVFTDMGISSAVVYKQDVTRKQLSSLYWLNLLAGFVVFCSIIALRPVIANFYNEPYLNELLIYVAFIFLVTPFGQQFQFLLQKELKFNELAKVEVTSIVAGSFCAVLLAIMDFGVLSLIWGQIVTACLKSILLAIKGWARWKPMFYFSLTGLREFIKFGVFQMGSRSVNYFASNIDYLLIGRFLGTEALGIYSLAYQLIVIPVTKINPIITKVAFPVFSMNQNDNQVIRKGFIQMTKLLAVVSFPMLIGLMAVSNTLVPVVFGDKWMESILVIQVLSLLGILRVLMNPNGSVLLAKGRADLGFIWDFFVAIFNGLAIWFVVKEGVVAVGIAYVAVSFVNFILGRKLLYHVIQLESKEYFSVLKKPFIISFLMGLLVYALEQVSLNFVSPNWFLLLLLVLAGIISYFALILWFDRPLVGKVKGILSKR